MLWRASTSTRLYMCVFAVVYRFFFFFFFSSRRRHTRFDCDWSSDVCSSDLARVSVALGGALVVIESHARREHVDECEALVLEARLDERHQLLLVAREAARHEGGAERHRQQHRVDRRLEVGLALLGPAADVPGCGKLPLGEPIDAVVLDDVQHVEVAADRVAELPETYGEGIAVARNSH